MTNLETPGAHTARAPEPTGWVGWVFFAGVMMALIGTYQIIMGLVAIFKDEYYLVGPSGLVVNVDYSAWGWAHLLLGVLLLLAGLGAMAGQMWARIVGIAVATISAIVNLAFIEAAPWWSVIVITLDVLVIYALAVHGAEAKNA